MKELSLHILDIAENSISACASHIEISIMEESSADLLRIRISDDGKGMNAETVGKLTDPFFTSRTTRRVGLGLPLLKEAAEACAGGLQIHSVPGRGTTIEAVFQNSHIDRMPMGDLVGTLITLLIGSPEVNWKFIYARDADIFVFDSTLVKETLGEIPYSDPFVLKWIKETLREGIPEA